MQIKQAVLPQAIVEMAFIRVYSFPKPLVL